MFWSILNQRWKQIILILFCSIISAIFGLTSPLLQKKFIDGLSSPNENFWGLNSAQFIFLAFLSTIFYFVFSQLTNFLATLESIHLQKKLSSLLFDKLFSLNLESRSVRPVGETISLYATDIPGAAVFLDQTIPQGLTTFIPFVIAPFALASMFQIPMLPVCAVMLVVTAFSFFLAYRQAVFFLNFKRLAAERIGIVNEWIQNIRLLKVLSWLHAYEKMIFDVRKIETKNRVSMVSNGQSMNAITSSITFFLNLFVLYLFLKSHPGEISAGTVFALFWVVGVFLSRPFRQMPWFFTFLFDSWTSTQRVRNFFDLENSNPEKSKELSYEFKQKAKEPETVNFIPEAETAIQISNLNLNLGGKRILKDISMTVHQQEKIALVGEIGSGKSMLLYSLVRESGATFNQYYLFSKDTKKMTDEQLHQHYSLVAQEGFVLSATLAQNIFMDFDSENFTTARISESLDMAEFNQDLQNLPEGLQTEIGEQGVNLSGGQRQRINLARGLYFERPILLLDDCFSALDVDTEKRLIETLFQQEFKEKTMVIATHRLNLLNYVDRVIYLSAGQIIADGTYQDILRTSPSFVEFTESLRVKETSLQ
ncbi:MAG: ABC transporter ATP-binding protein [Pseudobdellovibrionaceae bacterium]